MFCLLRVRWPLFIIGALVAVVVLSGCEYNNPQNTTTSAPQFTSVHVAGGSTGMSQLTSTHGSITMTLNARSYRTNETITVALKNERSQAIFFVDQHTNCTVLFMQQQVDGNWRNIENCYVGRRSMWSTLNPGQQLVVKLDPPRGNWLPGHYRVALDYSIGQASYSFTPLSSVDFQIEASCTSSTRSDLPW